MPCSSCGTPMRSLGSFVQAGSAQVFTNTGQVIRFPNESAGMHGLGADIFGANQINWITGIPNEYLIAGAGLILVFLVMK